jgi:hypothetical protein
MMFMNDRCNDLYINNLVIAAYNFIPVCVIVL